MFAQHLSGLHRAIIESYCIDYNASRVAKLFGCEPRDVTLAARSRVGKEYVKYLESKRLERTKISADRVLNELARIAFCDLRSIVRVDENGKVTATPSDALSADDAACVSEVSQMKDGGLRIKTHDKMAALDKLGKHLALFTDVVDNRISVNTMPEVRVGDNPVHFDIGSDPVKTPKTKGKDNEED